MMITEDDLAQALLEEAGAEARQPDDIDPYQMARLDTKLHRSDKWWKKWLDAKVEAGEMECKRVWGGRRTVTIYRLRKDSAV